MSDTPQPLPQNPVLSLAILTDKVLDLETQVADLEFELDERLTTIENRLIDIEANVDFSLGK
jgi:hypothetical protein